MSILTAHIKHAEKEAVKSCMEQNQVLINDRNELMRILSNNLLATSQKQLDDSVKEGKELMLRLTNHDAWRKA
jgi:hypothetical protein